MEILRNKLIHQATYFTTCCEITSSTICSEMFPMTIAVSAVNAHVVQAVIGNGYRLPIPLMYY